MKIAIRDITGGREIEEKTSGQAAAGAGEDSGRKRTVMVVDGVRQPLGHLAGLIRENGFRVLHVAHGKDAVEHLRTDEVALIVSGTNLADMPGALFYLQVMSASPDTVKFMISPSPDPSSDILKAAHIIHAGYVTRYLTGSWEDERIVKAIKDGVRQYELLKESRDYLMRIRSRTERLAALTGSLHESADAGEKALDKKAS